MTPAASFQRFAGFCAVMAGASGFAYAVSFLVISQTDARMGGMLSGFFLAAGGFYTSAVWALLYERLQPAGGGFALWMLLLGIGASLGAAVHGGYDLALAIELPRAAATELPSQIDPRGLLTFGVNALALMTAVGLMGSGGGWPSNLRYIGFLNAALCLVLYFGRLIIVTPTNPIIVNAALLNGFLVNPVWWVWLGLRLRADAEAVDSEEDEE